MIEPLSVIMWISVVLFAIASILAPLALLNKAKLGRTRKSHDVFTKRLFYGVIMAASTACITYVAARAKGEDIMAPLIRTKVVSGAARIANQSSRVELPENGRMITGIVVSGAGSKRLLLRAVGPGLRNLGVSTSLIDPNLEVFDSASLSTSSKMNGGNANPLPTEVTSSQFHALSQRLGLFSRVDGDVGLVVTLKPGAYTIVLASKSAAPGTVLFEICDLDWWDDLNHD